MTTYVATVEANHTIKAPVDMAVGERVMLVRVPSISSILNNPERRSRFAATRAAVDNAICDGFAESALSNDEIVALVKQARRATVSS